MGQIKVVLRDSADSGRLYPSYDEEADILAVGSRVSRAWPYGIDIDGAVIFDLDADRLIANFDLLVAKRYWEPTWDGPPPTPSRSASIEVAPESIKHKSFNLPLTVSSDRRGRFVYISFSTGSAPQRWVGLSEQCLAAIAGEFLVGFFVILDPA